MYGPRATSQAERLLDCLNQCKAPSKYIESECSHHHVCTWQTKIIIKYEVRGISCNHSPENHKVKSQWHHTVCSKFYGGGLSNTFLLRSLLYDNNFLTWFGIGGWLCCQPIENQVRKSLLAAILTGNHLVIPSLLGLQLIFASGLISIKYQHMYMNVLWSQ